MAILLLSFFFLASYCFGIESRGFAPTVMEMVRSPRLSWRFPETEIPALWMALSNIVALGFRYGFPSTINPSNGLLPGAPKSTTPDGAEISAPRRSKAFFSSSAYSSASGFWFTYVMPILRPESGRSSFVYNESSDRNLFFCSGVIVLQESCPSSLLVRWRETWRPFSAAVATRFALPAAVSARFALDWAFPAAMLAPCAEISAFPAAFSAAIASPCVLSTMTWLILSRSLETEFTRASPSHSKPKPKATNTHPMATTSFHTGPSSPTLRRRFTFENWHFNFDTASLTSCWISATSITTPIVTRIVAQTRRWRSASLNGISSPLRRLRYSTEKGVKSGATDGGLENTNQRDLRMLSIYWLFWAILFGSIVFWRIVLPIIRLCVWIVYLRGHKHPAPRSQRES